MAYYLAFNLSDSPLLIICSLSSNILAYSMAGMPMEFRRVILIVVIGILTSFSAQVFGIFCGSMSNVIVSSSFTSKYLKISLKIFLTDYSSNSNSHNDLARHILWWLCFPKRCIAPPAVELRNRLPKACSRWYGNRCFWMGS